jgi:hypothetical protein
MERESPMSSLDLSFLICVTVGKVLDGKARLRISTFLDYESQGRDNH